MSVGSSNSKSDVLYQQTIDEEMDDVEEQRGPIARPPIYVPRQAGVSAPAPSTIFNTTASSASCQPGTKSILESPQHLQPRFRMETRVMEAEIKSE